MRQKVLINYKNTKCEAKKKKKSHYQFNGKIPRIRNMSTKLRKL